GLLVLGLVWLLVVLVWFTNARSGLAAYVGSLWTLVCCVLVARTRTLSWGTCLRTFGLAVPWSVGVGLMSRWLADLVFVTVEEGGNSGAEVSGPASQAIGASVAIAGVTEEALKLVPVAVVAVLAARRARRFAVIDWLLLGVASGAAFMA